MGVICDGVCATWWSKEVGYSKERYWDWLAILNYGYTLYLQTLAKGVCLRQTKEHV